MDQELVKLTSSAYKLLDFFPESDPLKNRAKEKVLEIMSALGGSSLGGENSGDWMAVGKFFSTEREKKKIQVIEDIEILLGYLEIGKLQGWLSGINCLIVSEQYKKIKDRIYLRPELVKEATAEIKWPEKSVETEEKDISSRQRKILEFLEKNEKAQVMDLQIVLPKVTKRTIRRDLDELLKMSKIQRMGEFNKVFYKLV